MHLHVSLWRDGEPAFAPEGGDENALHRRAIARPAARTCPASRSTARRRSTRTSASRRSRSRPTTVTWGGDNRTVAVRSLVETPAATRHRAAHRRGRRAAALGRRRRCWRRSSPALEADEPPGARAGARATSTAAATPLPGDARRGRRGRPRRRGRSPRSWARTRSTTTRARRARVGDLLRAVTDWDREPLPAPGLMAPTTPAPARTEPRRRSRRAARVPGAGGDLHPPRRGASRWAPSSPARWRIARTPTRCRSSDAEEAILVAAGTGVTGVAREEWPFADADGAATGADKLASFTGRAYPSPLGHPRHRAVLDQRRRRLLPAAARRRAGALHGQLRTRAERSARCTRRAVQLQRGAARRPAPQRRTCSASTTGSRTSRARRCSCRSAT